MTRLELEGGNIAGPSFQGSDRSKPAPSFLDSLPITKDDSNRLAQPAGSRGRGRCSRPTMQPPESARPFAPCSRHVEYARIQLQFTHAQLKPVRGQED